MPSWLDAIEGNASVLGPMGNEVQTVVQANGQQCTAHPSQLVQGLDDSRSGQVGFKLDAQCFPVEFIDDIEGTKPATRWLVAAAQRGAGNAVICYVMYSKISRLREGLQPIFHG